MRWYYFGQDQQYCMMAQIPPIHCPWAYMGISVAHYPEPAATLVMAYWDSVALKSAMSAIGRWLWDPKKSAYVDYRRVL